MRQSGSSSCAKGCARARNSEDHHCAGAVSIRDHPTHVDCGGVAVRVCVSPSAPSAPWAWVMCRAVSSSAGHAPPLLGPALRCALPDLTCCQAKPRPLPSGGSHCLQSCLSHASMDVQLAAMKATCNFIQVRQPQPPTLAVPWPTVPPCAFQTTVFGAHCCPCTNAFHGKGGHPCACHAVLVESGY